MYKYAGQTDAWVRINTSRFYSSLRSDGVPFKVLRMKGSRADIQYDLVFFESSTSFKSFYKSNGLYHFNGYGGDDATPSCPILEIRGPKLKRFLEELSKITSVKETSDENKGSMIGSIPILGMISIKRRIGARITPEWLAKNPDPVGNAIGLVDLMDDLKIKSDREAKLLINKLFDVGGIPETVSIVVDPPVVIPEEIVEELKETIITSEIVEIEDIAEEVVESVVDTHLPVKPDILASVYQKVLLKEDSLEDSNWYRKGPGNSKVKKAMNWRLNRIRNRGSVVANYNALMTEGMRENSELFAVNQITEETTTMVLDALSRIKAFLIERLLIENDPSYTGRKLKYHNLINLSSLLSIDENNPSSNSVTITDFEKFLVGSMLSTQRREARIKYILQIDRIIKDKKSEINYVASLIDSEIKSKGDLVLSRLFNTPVENQIEFVKALGFRGDFPYVSNQMLEKANNYLRSTRSHNPHLRNMGENGEDHEKLSRLKDAYSNVIDGRDGFFALTESNLGVRITYVEFMTGGFYPAWFTRQPLSSINLLLRDLLDSERFTKVALDFKLLSEKEIEYLNYPNANFVLNQISRHSLGEDDPPTGYVSTEDPILKISGMLKDKKIAFTRDRYTDPVTGEETVYPNTVQGMVDLIGSLGVNVYMYSSSQDYNGKTVQFRNPDGEGIKTKLTAGVLSESFQKNARSVFPSVIESLKGVYWGLKVCQRYPTYDLRHLHIVIQKSRAHALTIPRHRDYPEKGSYATLLLSYADGPETAVHEIMHTLEYLSPSVRDFTTAHFAKTIVSPDSTSEYRTGEPTFELNNSPHSYTGKMYFYEHKAYTKFGGVDLATTPKNKKKMNLQVFAEGGEKLEKFAIDHPEFYLFAYNIIMGKVQIPESENAP